MPVPCCALRFTNTASVEYHVRNDHAEQEPVVVDAGDRPPVPAATVTGDVRRRVLRLP